jgi:hypothetical protein
MTTQPGYNIDMNTTYAVSTRYVPLYITAVNNFRDRAATATLFDLQAAEQWYADAGSFAQSLPRHDWSFATCCSVVSAFSPRVTWAQNKRKAMDYAHGITPKGLKAHVAAADRCVVDGFNGLRGLKTNAFARAISGDGNAVVVDVWMCRAARLGKDAPNKGEYQAIAAAVRTVAAEYSMSPAMMQAMIWIVVRGKAQ